MRGKSTMVWYAACDHHLNDISKILSRKVKSKKFISNIKIQFDTPLADLPFPTNNEGNTIFRIYLVTFKELI